jgi:hypothetical protein
MTEVKQTSLNHYIPKDSQGQSATPQICSISSPLTPRTPIKRFALISKYEYIGIFGIDITMHVPSLEKTMAWYADVLGWKHGCDLRNELVT